MDNKKFEQLIDLIINENEEQARELFHDIVVEKSREIYESLMDEEPGMDQVGGLLDELETDEEGMVEDEDELADIELDDGMGDEEEIDLDSEEFGDEEGGEEELEDRVVDLEDKLDELMAEFEQLMGSEEGEEGSEEDFGGEEDMGAEEGSEEDFGDEEVAEGAEEDEEDTLEESVQLQAVKGLYGSKIGGDDGDNKKSPALTKPKVVATGANPVKFSGQSETVPNSAKGPSNAYSKGETQVKGAGSFKNAPGQKGQDLAAAPKPQAGQQATNNKSPVAESRKTTTKRIVK